MAVRVQWVAGLMAGGAALVLLAAPSVLPSAWVAPLVPLRHATLGMVDQAFDRIKDALPAPRGAKAERSPVPPSSGGAPAVKPAQRTAIEGGRVVVSLSAEERERAGIET